MPPARLSDDPHRPALTDERLLRPHHAELISLRIGENYPGLSASLPDIDPACPERKKTADLLIAVCRAAGQVEMHAVLDCLRIGDRHEADPDGCILISPDDDLPLTLGQDLPAKRLRPEPGQRRQVMSVDDDVVKSDSHADSLQDTPETIPANPHSSAADRAISGVVFPNDITLRLMARRSAVPQAHRQATAGPQGHLGPRGRHPARGELQPEP